MRGSEFAELTAFAAIIEHGTFARAAAHLGVSPSALSQTIRALEARLGVRLLHRTTRSVSPSAAGERLMARLGPALDALTVAVSEVQRQRDEPAGALRLNVARLAAERLLAPLLGRFHAAYPGVTLELVVDDALRDIVQGRFDAGIRLGERLEQDMIAVKVSDELSLALVASPSYLAAHGAPQHPNDLRSHRCLNGRLATAGNLYRWEFERDDQRLKLDVTGPLIISEPRVLVQAAIDGAGIAYTIDLEVEEALARGALVRLLPEWSPRFPGFYLYYPSSDHPTAALRAFVSFMSEAYSASRRPEQAP